MNLEFHSAVQADLRRALTYFDRDSGPKTGDRFFAELNDLSIRIADHPTRYGFFDNDLRRASFKSFQYHLLYYIRPASVKVIALRHNRQNPNFGLSRR